MVPAKAREQFLDDLMDHGNVCAACTRTGLSRSTVYKWRADIDFANAWDLALEIHRDAIRQEVIDKAIAATGYVANTVAVDPRTGAPLLDDDFEPITYRKLLDYDPKILTALVGKMVRDETRRIDQRTLLINVDDDEAEKAPPTVTLVYDDDEDIFS